MTRSSAFVASLSLVCLSASTRVQADPIKIEALSEHSILVKKLDKKPTDFAPTDLDTFRTYNMMAPGNGMFISNFHILIPSGIKDLHIHLTDADGVFVNVIDRLFHNDDFDKPRHLVPGQSTVNLQGHRISEGTYFSVRITNGPSFDITPTATPEPSTVFLLTSGAVGVAIRTTRRKKGEAFLR